MLSRTKQKDEKRHQKNESLSKKDSAPVSHVSNAVCDQIKKWIVCQMNMESVKKENYVNMHEIQLNKCLVWEIKG